MNRLFLILLLMFCSFAESYAAVSTVHIEGLIKEKGSRKPLPLVNVYCFSDQYREIPIKTSTDLNGKFVIDVPEGKLRWVVSLSGYLRFQEEEQQLIGMENLPRDFYLEKTSYLTYETTVYGQTEKRDEKTKSLDQSQFLTLPGANGDPVKAIQNLPGINRSSFASSQIIIEGSAPNDTRYHIDNQDVPLIFHFGGLSSVVIPEAIDHVDYLSAGFGPEFGQSTAGLVNLTVRDPKTDRHHGFVFVDFFNTGGIIEGPITDHSSFLIGLRQSYIGAVLRGVIGKDSKDFSLTAAPDFRDTVLEYKNEITPMDSIKIVGIASGDTLGFLLTQPANQDPAIRGSFSSETDFFRVIPEWTHRFNSTLIGRYSLGMGKDWSLLNAGSFYSHTQSTSTGGRAEIEDQLSDTWKSYWGVDALAVWSNINFQLPTVSNSGGVLNPLGTGSSRTVSNLYSSQTGGLYWRNVIHYSTSPWTFTPGIRLSYFNLTHEWISEPRMGSKYEMADGWTLRGATGLYNQAPLIQNLDSTFGNPALKSQRAIHATVGVIKDFKGNSSTGWTLSNDFFYKYLYNIVANSTAYISPSQPEYYNNSGYGRVYGSEFLGKFKTTSWEGWISYTFSRSTRGNAQSQETLFQYDQTHLLTLVGDVELGKNWKFSARVRYTTGNPYTPIAGSVFDADNDVYFPLRGDLYSERIGPFFQADVRLDKKWIYNQWILTAYLDIENVTNRANPQQINYSYNYQQTATITGLPLFPTLGIKAEF